MTDSNPPGSGKWARGATTFLLVVLLAGLGVVAAAALSLSARPIVEVALGRMTSAGVPIPGGWFGSPDGAVVMVEGAVLFLTALWLHPWTRADVRSLARFGGLVGLGLSGAAGVTVYGGWVGWIPAGVYAFVCHAWIKAVLAHLAGAQEAGRSIRDRLRDAINELRASSMASRSAEASPEAADIGEWGSPSTVEDNDHLEPESATDETDEERDDVVASDSASDTRELPRLRSVSEPTRKRTRSELDAAMAALPMEFRAPRKAHEPLPVFRARVEVAERQAALAVRRGAEVTA